jgi:hypothetical protein
VLERAPATGGCAASAIASSLGDHAEQSAAWGFTTTTLDIFQRAIRTARKRFPKSEVNIAALVRPEGKLLAIVRGRESDEPEGELPVPLRRAEMNEFVRAGLAEESFEASKITLTTRTRPREDFESCTAGHEKRNAR